MSQNNAQQDALRTLDARLKQAIQTLFVIQSNLHNYEGPNTQHSLGEQVRALQPQLAALTDDELPELPTITREIIEYVDGGRNPDIYTREIVEFVQRSNAYLKGKLEGLSEFRDVLAEELVKGFGPEIEPLVLRATWRAPDQLAAMREEAKAGQVNGV